MTRTPDWQSDDGSIQLHCCDCLNLLPTMPAGAVDCIITSPPYNLGNTSGGGFPSLGHYDPAGGYTKRGGGGKWRRASMAGGIGHGYAGFDDNMPHADYVAWQKRVLSKAWRTIADDGAIFYNHKPRVFSGQLVTPLEYIPADLTVRQVVIWARAGGIHHQPRFAPVSESQRAHLQGSHVITSAQIKRICAGGYAKEGDLVKEIIRWLTDRRCVVWKQNQGGMNAEHQGRKRFVRFAHIDGISDVIGLTPAGRFIAVEAKQPGKHPTPEQAAFLASVRSNGGIALVVHNLDELAEQYGAAK